MLNATQRRFHQLCGVISTHQRHVNVPLCAHRLPICLLRVPEHWVPLYSGPPTMPSTSPWALGSHLIERLPFGLLHVPEPRVPFQVYLTQNIFVNVISVTHEFTVSESYFISMLSSISPSNIKLHAFHQIYLQIFLEIITIPCFS